MWNGMIIDESEHQICESRSKESRDLLEMYMVRHTQGSVIFKAICKCTFHTKWLDYDVITKWHLL